MASRRDRDDRHRDLARAVGRHEQRARRARARRPRRRRVRQTFRRRQRRAARGDARRCARARRRRVTTGGLGPTVDDLTKDAVAARRRHDARAARAVAARDRGALRSVRPADDREQPPSSVSAEGCVVLENPHGTAPGFVALRADGKFVACMPGVPREMKPMLAERLVPWLVERYGLRDGDLHAHAAHGRHRRVASSTQQVEDLFRTLENPKIAMLAHGGRVDVKVMAKATSRGRGRRDDRAGRRRAAARGSAAATSAPTTSTLAGAIVADARARAACTLATAESCTGGADRGRDRRASPAPRPPSAAGSWPTTTPSRRALLGVAEETLDAVRRCERGDGGRDGARRARAARRRRRDRHHGDRRPRRRHAREAGRPGVVCACLGEW